VTLGVQFNETVRDVTLNQMVAECLRLGLPARDEISIGDCKLEVNAVPTKDAAGLVSGAVVLFHEITQLKQLDEVRKDFVANVSHELRTPLSILRGYIETLRDNPETSPKELGRILEVMERHSKRLGLLLDDLLTLARLESVNPNLQLSDVSLGPLLDNVARDWEKKLAEKHLTIRFDLNPELPPLRADETRLQEILYNLLDNAVKYSREGGEIRLAATQHGNEIELSVADTGEGIAKNDLPRIFERFYRADKARSRDGIKGTGLGLSIVKHIAQLHGGRVEAKSESGLGTTIRVLLPVANSPAKAVVTQT
jgi:two-component system phosphate regulon sensor histidine kinase PhoR